MKLSTIKKISVFGLFGMSFLTHFIYNIFPNPLFAIFFPVNESIWEHMKLLSTTILLYGIIEYFLLKHYNIKVNNFLFSLFIMSVISIPIYLIIFLPFYYKGINSMFFYLLVMFITYIICCCISYYILKFKEIKYQNVISIIFIIIIYIIFGYLTYNPLKNDMFFDTEEAKYGINEYIL